jgi:hypothetical protein
VLVTVELLSFGGVILPFLPEPLLACGSFIVFGPGRFPLASKVPPVYVFRERLYQSLVVTPKCVHILEGTNRLLSFALVWKNWET